MKNMLKSLQNYSQTLFQDITTFGGIVFYGFILGLILLTNQFQLFYRLLFGLLFTFLITILIRTFYFKNRPNIQTHNNYIERIDASSFPSWHTARIFFLTLVFIQYFQKEIIISTFLIAIACLTAYSRIYLKKHDWIDLIGGFILAIITFYCSNLLIY